MMGTGQKIFTTVLWAVTVLMMLVLVGAGLWIKRHPPAEPVPVSVASHSWDAPAFALTDQNDNAVTNDALRGEVWIADFIFTHCAGPCPKMTAMMAELQSKIDRPDVKFVSFSVDPERDTPAVLKEYAARYGADPKRWHFLTGTTKQMTDVADGMKVAAEKNPDQSITHGTYFFLVDRAGKVRGIYRQSDPTEIERLASDAVALAEQTGSAAGQTAGRAAKESRR
jgi:protein SCO1/2